MANAVSAVTTDHTVTIPLEGCLTAYTVGPVWRSALDILRKNPSRPVVVNADKLESVDATGIALLFDLRRRPRPADAAVTIRNLAPNIEALVGSFDPKDFLESSEAVTPPGLIEAIGRAAAEEAADARTLIAFLGEATAGLFAALSRLRSIHWHDVLTLAQEAGANAVAIVLLIGFLMGVIIAFEIGLVAQQFGAVIFVVNGVGIAMLRELGPLMTAILFAGRSGAAFDAEIGTQKVNEEIDALTTFGIDPVQFLVVPRLIALDTVSQPFLARAIADLRQHDEVLVLDVDLTGRPISSTSESFPGAAFGYRDGEVRLGYQLAEICLQSRL